MKKLKKPSLVDNGEFFKPNFKRAFNLIFYDLAKGFFIILSFVSMITTGFFGIPLITNFFLNTKPHLIYFLFALFSLLNCIWGLMAYNQFDKVIKLVKKTKSLSNKLDPMIGDYKYNTFNPETKELEEGYTHYGNVDFWDSDNDVPQWMDKAKYWKIFIELQRINKNTILQISKDKNPYLSSGKKILAVTIKSNERSIAIKDKKRSKVKYRVILPQWVVLNTEYKKFNSNFQSEINNITNTIAEVNKNIPNLIDEIIYREKIIMNQPWNLLISLVTYLNISLPIRIIYSKIKSLTPGAKNRKIQYINDNLSGVSINVLIDAIILKARKIGVDEKSCSKLLSLIKFLKNEYEKVGLGEGASEYHNLHHSLEVAYMSLNMLPKEIHGYNFENKDYEIMVIAALLHDYDPMHDRRTRKSYSRIPRVPNTLDEIRKKRIHDAYFIFSNEDLIKFFRKNDSPYLPTQEFVSTHPEYLKNKESKIESKIVEALIWRTDFPFDISSQNNFKNLLHEINDKNGYTFEKINLIAEILSLSDLSVTYLSSDPLLAWNRVVRLYQELDLPVIEAIAGTDRFLSLFAEGSLFKEIISRKNFPVSFKQKWENVYAFFHEGNPSNHINKIILDARTRYQKINMEINMNDCDFLISSATTFMNEFFIGIGKNKETMIHAQSKLKMFNLENLMVYPGNMEKLLPFVKDKSIDNFIVNLYVEKNTDIDNTRLLNDLLYSYNIKLVLNGTIKIIFNKNQNSSEIELLIPKDEFKILNESINTIPKNIINKDLIDFEYLKNIKIITVIKK